jgi:methionyl-tRNA formyltransferase
MLRRENIQISTIVILKLLNHKRFFSEFKRDRIRLIKKIWKKLFLRKRAYHKTNENAITSFMQRKNIPFNKVEDFAHTHKIPIIYCTNLNDAIVVKELKKINPDLVVFTGGGLIRNEVLENSGAGVLNCHMGILPRYRGMDVIEWAILEKNFELIGTTVHFMDKGVDTGDILSVKKLELKPDDTIREIREKFEPVMCREIVQTTINYLNEKIKRKPQRIEDGKQFFIMHPRLLEMVKSSIR